MNIQFFDFEIFDLEGSSEVNIFGSESSDLLLLIEEEEFTIHKELISKIMGAINYNIDNDIRICLLRQAQNVNLAQLVGEGINYVIAFGINPKNLSLNASFKANYFYKTESFEIMLSHSLTELNENKVYKKSLWTELQKKFLK